MNNRPNRNSTLAVIQGGYYLLTGLLPVVSMRTHERLMGRRREPWLMKTHSIAMTAIGGVLLWAGLRRSQSPEVPVLGAASAASMVLPEAYYMITGRVKKNYLMDLLPQLAILGLWAYNNQQVVTNMRQPAKLHMPPLPAEGVPWQQDVPTGTVSPV